jgi:hypothetical protein
LISLPRNKVSFTNLNTFALSRREKRFISEARPGEEKKKREIALQGGARKFFLIRRNRSFYMISMIDTKQIFIIKKCPINKIAS